MSPIKPRDDHDRRPYHPPEIITEPWGAMTPGQVERLVCSAEDLAGATADLLRSCARLVDVACRRLEADHE